MSDNETQESALKKSQKRGAARYEAQSERITDRARITTVLKRIMSKRALLSVNLAGNNKSYNSAILEIDPEQDYLILDELSPKAGHALISNSTDLIIQARAEGVETRFKASVIDIGLDNGVAYYRLPFPGTMHYFQRRAHFRASVGIAKEISVVLTRENDEIIRGALHDISVGGIGIRFHRSSTEQIAEGETIPRCVIRFPDGDEFICTIEARTMRHSVTGNYRVLGVRFIGLSGHQRNKIQQFVANLDREMRKHAPIHE